MEYVTATLNTPAQGKCDGCGNETELVKTVTQIKRDGGNKDAMGHPRVKGETGYLICADCRENPLWRDE